MKFCVIDVESKSLHGEAFAVGTALLDDSGSIERDFYGAVRVKPEDCDEYVRENVLPNIGEPVWYETIEDLRSAFVAYWNDLHLAGYRLAADVPWPCEANFLSSCFSGGTHDPYPVYDISSMMAAWGFDPAEIYPRKEDEIPEHHAQNDAMQSARLLRDFVMSPKSIWTGEVDHGSSLNRLKSTVIVCCATIEEAVYAFQQLDDGVVIQKVQHVGMVKPVIG